MPEFEKVRRVGIERDLYPEAVILWGDDGQPLGSAANPIHTTSSTAAASGPQAVTATALPLPTGAATESTLAGLKAAVLAQIDLAATLWTDSSGAYYVRRDLIAEGTGAVTVAFTDPAGAVATPGAGLKPAATSKALQTTTLIYDVLTTGSGYTAGDTVARVLILDTSAAPPTVAASSWINFTTGMVLPGVPVSSDIVQSTRDVSVKNFPVTQPLPTGAATAANQATEITSLSTIAANSALASSAALQTAGNTSLATLAALKGTAAKAASLSVTFASDAQTDPIGRVGGIGTFASPGAITVTAASAYATGALVGGKLTFASATRTGVTSGIVQSVILTSASAQTSSTFDVVFFNADPTSTTFTDKVAFSVATADLPKIIGVAHCTDVTAVGGTITAALNLALPFVLASGTALYAAIIVRGAPTFTSSTDVAVRVAILQD